MAEGADLEKNAPIKLHYIDQTAHVFNVDDYMKIRTEYRMPGKLIGCCPKWPLNSRLMGLPAIYTPYETRLLIERGYAVLIEKNFNETPSEDIQRKYKATIHKNESVIADFCREKKVQESEKAIDKIIAGKMKKSQARGLNPNEITVENILNEIRDNYIFKPENVLIEIPTTEPYLVDYKIVRELPTVKPLHYRVYVHFWEQEKWITLGERFGADFLVYPGEPLYFHASHLVHVIKDVQNRRIPLTELIAKGRLSIVVNKFCLFAYENPNTDQLCFQTVQWEGHDRKLQSSLETET